MDTEVPWKLNFGLRMTIVADPTAARALSRSLRLRRSRVPTCQQGRREGSKSSRRRAEEAPRKEAEAEEARRRQAVRDQLAERRKAQAAKGPPAPQSQAPVQDDTSSEDEMEEQGEPSPLEGDGTAPAARPHPDPAHDGQATVAGMLGKTGETSARAAAHDCRVPGLLQQPGRSTNALAAAGKVAGHSGGCRL